MMAHKKSMSIFIMVGLLSAMVYFGSFTVFFKGLHCNYKVSVVIAYVMSVMVHFTSNRRFAFDSHHHCPFGQLPRYLTMIGISFLVTFAITCFVVEHLHLSPYWGMLISLGVTVNLNYFLARYWVFPVSRAVIPAKAGTHL